MGCDIHCYAEVKRGKKWVKVAKVFDNPYYDPKHKGKYSWNTPKTDQPYGDRNYDLFGILADVRNGRGFAGCDLGDGFVPIAMPKGLPSDVSDKVKKISNEWGGDGHSHSYFTVDELLKYDWTQKSKLRGYIKSEQYRKWVESGRGEPKGGYCGDVNGNNVIKVSNAEMEQVLNKIEKEFIKTKTYKGVIDYYTQIEWGMSYAEAVGRVFFDKTLPSLAKLGKSDKVRIVFWFDN